MTTEIATAALKLTGREMLVANKYYPGLGTACFTCSPERTPEVRLHFSLSVMRGFFVFCSLKAAEEFTIFNQYKSR